MTKVAVDSSVIIDFLRQSNNKDSLFVRLLEQDAQLVVSIMTFVEVYSGKSVWESKKVNEKVGVLFSKIEIIGVDTAIGLKAGFIKANYKLSAMDSIIAATALQHNLALSTLNIKDFEKVPKLKLHQ